MEINDWLRIDTIKSKVTEYGVIEKLDDDNFKSLTKENFGEDGFCVLYLDYNVLIGRYDGEMFHFFENETFKPMYIKKMRLFDINKELFLWRKNRNGFGWRLRVDEIGDDTDIVDALQVLWGTKPIHTGDYTEISEERGTKIILPFKRLEVDNLEKRVFIWTRNYVSYDTYCPENEKNNSGYEQAGYNDCRFVGFRKGNLSNNKLIFSELE